MVQWFFFDYRQRIIDAYTPIFEAESTDGKQKFQTSTSINWGWYEALFTLSGGDITKFEEVSRINVDTALTFILYLKDKSKQK